MVLGQEVHYHIIYIAEYTELNKNCNYASKRRFCRENNKYAADENFCGHFCPRRKAANFCHPDYDYDYDYNYDYDYDFHHDFRVSDFWKYPMAKFSRRSLLLSEDRGKRIRYLKMTRMIMIIIIQMIVDKYFL